MFSRSQDWGWVCGLRCSEDIVQPILGTQLRNLCSRPPKSPSHSIFDVADGDGGNAGPAVFFGIDRHESEGSLHGADGRGLPAGGAKADDEATGGFAKRKLLGYKLEINVHFVSCWWACKQGDSFLEGIGWRPGSDLNRRSLA